MKEGYWSWRVGDDEIIISSTNTKRFLLLLNQVVVGDYQSAEAALEDALRGTHGATPSGLRTIDLAPSDSLADWPFVEAP